MVQPSCNWEPIRNAEQLMATRKVAGNPTLCTYDLAKVPSPTATLSICYSISLPTFITNLTYLPLYIATNLHYEPYLLTSAYRYQPSLPTLPTYYYILVSAFHSSSICSHFFQIMYSFLSKYEFIYKCYCIHLLFSLRCNTNIFLFQ